MYKKVAPYPVNGYDGLGCIALSTDTTSGFVVKQTYLLNRTKQMDTEVNIRLETLKAKRAAASPKLWSANEIACIGEYLDAEASGLLKGSAALADRLRTRFMADAVANAERVGLPIWQKVVSRSCELSDLWESALAVDADQYSNYALHLCYRRV